MPWAFMTVVTSTAGCCGTASAAVGRQYTGNTVPAGCHTFERILETSGGRAIVFTTRLKDSYLEWVIEECERLELKHHVADPWINPTHGTQVGMVTVYPKNAKLIEVPKPKEAAKPVVEDEWAPPVVAHVGGRGVPGPAGVAVPRRAEPVPVNALGRPVWNKDHLRAVAEQREAPAPQPAARPRPARGPGGQFAPAARRAAAPPAAPAVAVENGWVPQSGRRGFMRADV